MPSSGLFESATSAMIFISVQHLLCLCQFVIASICQAQAIDTIRYAVWLSRNFMWNSFCGILFIMWNFINFNARRQAGFGLSPAPWISQQDQGPSGRPTSG